MKTLFLFARKNPFIGKKRHYFNKEATKYAIEFVKSYKPDFLMLELNFGPILKVAQWCLDNNISYFYYNPISSKKLLNMKIYKNTETFLKEITKKFNGYLDNAYSTIRFYEKRGVAIEVPNSKLCKWLDISYEMYSKNENFLTLGLYYSDNDYIKNIKKICKTKYNSLISEIAPGLKVIGNILLTDFSQLNIDAHSLKQISLKKGRIITKTITKDLVKNV